MRLIDAEALIEALNRKKIPYNADIDKTIREMTTYCNPANPNGDKSKEIINRAVGTFGVNHQSARVVEKMGGLIQAIMQISGDEYTGFPSILPEVIRLIAEVKIGIEQLEIIYGKIEVEVAYKIKLRELEDRIEKQRQKTDRGNRDGKEKQ